MHMNEYILKYEIRYCGGQRIWVPRPISNNKTKGLAEEENVRE